MNVTKLAWQIARTCAKVSGKPAKNHFAYGMKKAHSIARAKRKAAALVNVWNKAKVAVDCALMPKPVWTDSFGIEKA